MCIVSVHICRITANWRKNKQTCHKAKYKEMMDTHFPIGHQERVQRRADAADKRRQIQDGRR